MLQVDEEVALFRLHEFAADFGNKFEGGVRAVANKIS